MKITVKVITRARQEKVERQADGSYKVWVRVVAERGRANERVRELLAEKFGKPRRSLKVLSGSASSKKLVEIF